jgi:amino acid transporter
MSNGSTRKLTLFALTAMVVGGMVGSGIFSLSRIFANATGPFGAIIAWTISGAGMLMLAFVFQSLANGKPCRDAGGPRDRWRIRMARQRPERCASPACVKRSGQNNEE